MSIRVTSYLGMEVWVGPELITLVRTVMAGVVVERNVEAAHRAISGSFWLPFLVRLLSRLHVQEP